MLNLPFNSASSTLILAGIVATTTVNLSAATKDSWSKHHEYKFITLSAPFAGVDQTLGHGINDLDSIVGSYHDAAGDHGFVLDRETYTPINFNLAPMRMTR